LCHRGHGLSIFAPKSVHPTWLVGYAHSQRLGGETSQTLLCPFSKVWKQKKGFVVLLIGAV